MNALRLVLVTQRFWPLTGGAERLLSELAVRLRQQGAEARIVTAQWEAGWPQHIVYRGVPVDRLPRPDGRWGRCRYLHHLGRWLKTHCRQLDLAMVSGLKEDAFTTLLALRGTPVAVVLRAEGSGVIGDCHWQQTSRYGRRICQRCQRADAVIAPDQTTRHELVTAGYPQRRIHLIGGGMRLPPERDAHRREAARHALAQAHQLLAVPPAVPLVLYAGPLHQAMGLDRLIAAWPSVLGRWPAARLWLVGHGPHEAQLWHCIHARRLADSIVMPGSFDDLTDLLYAADVFVVPARGAVTLPALWEAMAAALPVVAGETAEHHRLLAGGRHGLLVADDRPDSLARAIEHVLLDRQAARSRAAAARRFVQQQWQPDEVTHRYLDVFQQALAEKQRVET